MSGLVMEFPRGRRGGLGGGRRWGSGVAGVEVVDDLAGVGEVGAPEPVVGELWVGVEGADEAVEERGDVEG